jgi:hypothetical protein
MGFVDGDVLTSTSQWGMAGCACQVGLQPFPEMRFMVKRGFALE